MTAHIYAELMKQYAEDATKTDKPWKLWEYRCKGVDEHWRPLIDNPNWCSYNDYRRIDPYRELKEAAADPTKQIKCCDSDWCSSNWNWTWSNPPEDYQIRDKPIEKKKVKMWQWIFKDKLGNYYTPDRYYKSQKHALSCWESMTAIGPALWTEIEVEE